MDFEREQEEWAKVGLDFHHFYVDLDFEEYPTPRKPLFFTKVNGAIVNQDKRDAFIEVDRLIDNKFYNGCFCTLEQGEKLGDFFSCLPYGIINKTITGIGATTLELNSERNSIIVLPTKSLAYSKYKSKNEKDGEFSCMYVGSPISDILSDITPAKIQQYLNLENGKYKKFLVVADSLPKVLNVIGKKHYNDYFLMIDEIDTLQIDNTYRPALENVIDYYAKFKQSQRASVTATLREITHPELSKETVITTAYKINPTRHIQLRHTNNEDYCTIETIKNILEKSGEDKILIAYNSLDGILICISLLKEMLGDNLASKIGILCGEKSKDKAGKYFIEITNDRCLPKQIVFMTCAYFVGIDINEPCHIISVSTFNQPFTLLSSERLTQIAGRCRKGALSETIVYETKQMESEYTLTTYKDRLLRKAILFTSAINKFKEVLDDAPELAQATEHMENIIKYVSVEKVANDYPVPLLRQDINKQLVPSYFNIDALLERWELHYSLYKDKKSLPNKLKEQGHIIEEIPLYHTFTEEQKLFLGIVKQEKEVKLKQDLQQAKQNLMEWDEIQFPKLKAETLKKFISHAPKQIQKFYLNFSKLASYYPTPYLSDLLIEHHNDDKRLYKKFFNSLVLWTLDDNHSFKVLMTGKFNYKSIIGATERNSRINVNPTEKRKKMKEVCDTYFRGYPISESVATSLLQCFFKAGLTKKHFRIIGLNPMDFQEPIQKITESSPEYLLELLMIDNFSKPKS
jgi:hypothetical protein